MRQFLEWLDRLGGIEAESSFVRWLERAAFGFLILMFLAAPHSIAATQIAWLTGMFIWVVRLFIKPRPRLFRTPLDLPLWIFFGWSVVTCVFSYDPPTSFDKLRNVLLFLIFYYVINVVRSKRAGIFLAFAIIVSCMVSVAWTPVERIFGRGVEIVGTSKEGPLTKALLFDGDTLLKANNRKIKTPDDLVAEIQANEVTKVTVYRRDFDFTVNVPRANLLGGTSALERLGIADWKRSRNWRSAGFYGHYTTFAEVLQLIASLTFGLLVASLVTRKRGDAETPEMGRQGDAETRRQEIEQNAQNNTVTGFSRFRFFSASPRLRVSASLLLAACVVGMAFALLLTVTRASQLGFLISAFTIVLLTGNRKIFLILAAIVLPIALGGLVFLQQSRQVGFFDANDDSTRDRQTFYRKGFDLWTQNARHLLLGVGMDANKSHIQEWNLYDNQGKPMGHFHSTPLQLLVERGLPALLLWLWVLWVYGRTLFRGQRSGGGGQESGVRDQELEVGDQRSADDNPKPKIQNPKSFDWRTQGIVWGSFGGIIGFFASGLVHYNLGDAEVAMVFFMLMGLAVRMKAEG